MRLILWIRMNGIPGGISLSIVSVGTDTHNGDSNIAQATRSFVGIGNQLNCRIRRRVGHGDK